MSEEQTEAIEEVANETISKVVQQQKRNIDMQFIQYPGAAKALADLGMAVSNITDYNDFYKGLFHLTKQQQKFVDELNLGTNTLLINKSLLESFPGLAGIGTNFSHLIMQDQRAYDTIKSLGEPYYKMLDMANSRENNMLDNT